MSVKLVAGIAVLPETGTVADQVPDTAHPGALSGPNALKALRNLARGKRGSERHPGYQCPLFISLFAPRGSGEGSRVR